MALVIFACRNINTNNIANFFVYDANDTNDMRTVIDRVKRFTASNYIHIRYSHIVFFLKTPISKVRGKRLKYSMSPEKRRDFRINLESKIRAISSELYMRSSNSISKERMYLIIKNNVNRRFNWLSGGNRYNLLCAAF